MFRFEKCRQRTKRKSIDHARYRIINQTKNPKKCVIFIWIVGIGFCVKQLFSSFHCILPDHLQHFFPIRISGKSALIFLCTSSHSAIFQNILNLQFSANIANSAVASKNRCFGELLWAEIIERKRKCPNQNQNTQIHFSGFLFDYCRFLCVS